MIPPKFNKWTSTLWAVFLLNSVLFSLFLFAINGEKETAGVYGLRVLQFDAWEDSWGPMYKAILHLREKPDTPIYSELFFAEQTKYPLDHWTDTNYLRGFTTSARTVPVITYVSPMPTSMNFGMAHQRAATANISSCAPSNS